MAKNRKYKNGRYLYVAVPDGTKSGDPVVFGQMPGVAITDRDDNGKATVDFGGVYNLSVTGADNAGNAAITAGDIVYYDGGDINIDSTDGTRFGYTLEDVSSGATSTIPVKIGY